MKNLQNYFCLETSYSKKHILNTCNKKVPQEYLDQIENGCSIEQLEKMMAQKFDVFKYKTQITIHGLFSELSTRRIGGYVNLTQNKNKSIGVRYTAIDYKKKTRLYNLLAAADGWSIEENSTTFSIYKMEKLPNIYRNSTEEEKQNYLSECKRIVEKFKSQAERIDRKNFVGHVDCYLSESFFGKFVVLSVNIMCFYEKDFQKIFENISGKTLSEGQAIAEQKRLEKERKAKEWQEQYERDRLEREKKDAEMKANFLANNPLPETFVKTEKFTPQIGDIYAILHKSWSSEYSWKYFVISTHAGRILTKPCDENGNVEKYAKGTVLKGDLTIDGYLKRETPKVLATPKVSSGKLFITMLSNSFLLCGETYPHRKRIKELGGKWNKWQKAWSFTKTAETVVRKEFAL